MAQKEKPRSQPLRNAEELNKETIASLQHYHAEYDNIVNLHLAIQIQKAFAEKLAALKFAIRKDHRASIIRFTETNRWSLKDIILGFKSVDRSEKQDSPFRRFHSSDLPEEDSKKMANFVAKGIIGSISFHCTPTKAGVHQCEMKYNSGQKGHNALITKLVNEWYKQYQKTENFKQQALLNYRHMETAKQVVNYMEQKLSMVMLIKPDQPIYYYHTSLENELGTYQIIKEIRRIVAKTDPHIEEAKRIEYIAQAIAGIAPRACPRELPYLKRHISADDIKKHHDAIIHTSNLMSRLCGSGEGSVKQLERKEASPV